MTNEEIEKASVSQLIRAVEETGSYAFLIGSGTSKPKPAGIPTGGELTKIWQKECYDLQNTDLNMSEWVDKKEEGIDDNDKYGFWFEERHPTSGQRRERIRDLVEDATPTPGHIILASLMSNEGKQNYIPHTLTTNFDDLLFDAFYLYLEDKPQLVDHRAVAPEFKLTRDRPAIVKLHGDYLYNNLQNTEEETEALEQGMGDALRQTVNEYGLVVIGYSGTDRSIMDSLLDTEISEYGVYWCTRSPDNLSEDAEELLEQSDSYVVPIKSFENLMAQFGTQVDSVEPPTREELINRAENRADLLEGVVEERQEAATDEEEEYMEKWTLYSEASDALHNGNYQKSISICNDILEKDPKDEVAYNNRGLVKLELESYEEAVEDFNKSIEIDSDNAQAFSNRGIAKVNLGQIEEGIQDQTRSIEVEPENIDSFHNRAEARILAGDFEGAIQDAGQASILSNSAENDALSLMLKLISKIVLESKVSDDEEKYKELCKQDFTTDWNFGELCSWLENADLESKKKEKIEELLDLFREHRVNHKEK